METYTNGTYTIISNSLSNTYGYLYNRSFDPSNPSRNLIISNDGTKGNGQFRILHRLQPYRTYILVVAIYEPTNKEMFQIRIVGPAQVFRISMMAVSGKLIRTSNE